MGKNTDINSILEKHDGLDFLAFSIGEMSEVFKLSVDEAQTLERRVASRRYNIRENVKSAAQLGRSGVQVLSLGDEVMDVFLRGGVPTGILSEISGVSGSGKTQVAMQLCAMATLNKECGGLDTDVLVLATGRLFEVERFKEICKHAYAKFGRQDYTVALDRVKLIHISDASTLVHVIQYQLPHAVTSSKCKMVLISSVSAVFTYNNDEDVSRNELLLKIGVALKKIANENNAVVLCVNQATAAVVPITEDNSISNPNMTYIKADEVLTRKNLFLNVLSDHNDIPSLGLLWQSMTTLKILCILKRGFANNLFYSSRRMSVISPYHDNSMFLNFNIDATGVSASE